MAKLRALYQVGIFRPKFGIGIICLSIFAAMLEGIGMSFIVPIIQLAQGSTSDGASSIGQLFRSLYRFAGIPFTLETVVVGVSAVMVLRYTSSFIVAWLRAALRTRYIRHLQIEGFENALAASVPYFDEHGSDEILNAIVTQSEYAGDTIHNGVRLLEQGFLSLMYLSLALYIAPWLTILTGIVLGAFLYLFRTVLESGYSLGGRVAKANERVQETAQAGAQGIREVKLFGLVDELFDEFVAAVNQFADSQIRLRRNQAMLGNLYQLVTAVTVFVMIYLALTFASLSLESLGLFLFTMFRLAPRAGNLSNIAYNLEGNLPHLVRTQMFVDGLQAQHEVDDGELSPTDPVDRVTFSDVEFAYGDERILDGLSFEIQRGEFVGFVGPSGAGKSTIVALLSRMYQPDRGEIRADDVPIQNFDLNEWRERISVVRQDPHIFNETLEYNITLGNRNVEQEAIQSVCEIAQVTEFLNDLPSGFDTVLGDEGVRLSGGQRQRVALARALLKDADLLILDEATSDLDSNIEERVHTAIEGMERDYAMLVIAHRLSTVVNADCIYTVEDGRIAESGTHTELVEEDGTYADLYSTQTQSR